MINAQKQEESTLPLRDCSSNFHHARLLTDVTVRRPILFVVPVITVHTCCENVEPGSESEREEYGEGGGFNIHFQVVTANTTVFASSGCVFFCTLLF